MDRDLDGGRVGRSAHRRLGSADCGDDDHGRLSLSLSPERPSDVERRSFLRAYSRKSIESNPEDEEFVVGYERPREILKGCLC
jgi:hypothetical protein